MKPIKIEWTYTIENGSKRHVGSKKGWLLSFDDIKASVVNSDGRLERVSISDIKVDTFQFMMPYSSNLF